MGSTKHPLTAQEVILLDTAISKIDRTTNKGAWLYKALKVFRYTGLHSSALYRPEANIREINQAGTLIIVWSRPMKGAKKGVKNYWKEVKGVPKSQHLDFDVSEFYQDNLRSKRKNSAWKQLIYDRLQVFGKEIGIPELSPNTLRHTAFMIFFEMGIPEIDISDMTGTSIKTIREYYNRMGPKSRAELMKKQGW